eukprot:TRINITY_DN47892_c0_g1_i1.p1 TRINITY_DN47892_c0_g1~~TRINITY_DN47892_c0_g1_i1.p1  ORF type:complete len:320 (+),score=64.81 TRINITY_DN47892_c0_g1_i1:98-1057(+)
MPPSQAPLPSAGMSPRPHWDPGCRLGNQAPAKQNAHMPSFVTQATRPGQGDCISARRVQPRGGTDTGKALNRPTRAFSSCGSWYLNNVGPTGQAAHSPAACRRTPQAPETACGRLQNRSPSEVYSESRAGCTDAAWGSPCKEPGQGDGRKVLIVDLDETLVHSCFEACQCDIQLPIVVDGQKCIAYVKKRPGCDEFLRRATRLFDVVIWTASLELYAGPLIDVLQRDSRCGPLKRMFRSDCTQLQVGYCKDLSTLGRSLDEVAIIDNTPGVAALQPRNLIGITSWFDDASDRELLTMLPMLQAMARANSVYDVLYPEGG